MVKHSSTAMGPRNGTPPMSTLYGVRLMVDSMTVWTFARHGLSALDDSTMIARPDRLMPLKLLLPWLIGRPCSANVSTGADRRYGSPGYGTSTRAAEVMASRVLPCRARPVLRRGRAGQLLQP